MNHSENSNHYGLLIDIIFPLKHISQITACSDASCMLEVQSKKKKKREHFQLLSRQMWGICSFVKAPPTSSSLPGSAASAADKPIGSRLTSISVAVISTQALKQIVPFKLRHF